MAEPNLLGKPIFLGVNAILLQNGFSPPRFELYKRKLIERQGTHCHVLSSKTTHIVAGSWTAVMSQFAWSDVNRLVETQALKVVSFEWMCESLKMGVLVHEGPFNLMLTKMESEEDARKTQAAKVKRDLVDAHWQHVNLIKPKRRRL